MDFSQTWRQPVTPTGKRQYVRNGRQKVASCCTSKLLNFLSAEPWGCFLTEHHFCNPNLGSLSPAVTEWPPDRHIPSSLEVKSDNYADSSLQQLIVNPPGATFLYRLPKSSFKIQCFRLHSCGMSWSTFCYTWRSLQLQHQFIQSAHRPESPCTLTGHWKQQNIILNVKENT